MNIQQLPNDILQENEQKVQVYDYYINSACLKNKVALTKNVFSFLVEGSKELITHDETVTIGNDKFMLIKSGNCLMSETLSPSNNYHSILLFFTDEAILNFATKNKLNILNTKVHTPYHICKYDDFIENFVASLKHILTQPTSLQEKLLQLKLEEILLYLIYKKGKAFIENFIVNEDNFALKFKDVIENNRLNNLTIQELSFLCNMSSSTFKRNFENHYETSPIRWFQEQRLAHSAYLLGTKNKRPIDIYTQIGFESLSSFTQAFKQKFNTTPKQFQLDKMNF
ncbi:MAG: helix-turn-helix transcriptional regulator [Bacteroidia bacterium]|nr:helix-turn-helix transcriptional regulator [Bacteroidia bacterium]